MSENRTWRIRPLPVPPHSDLYHLEPIGIGSPYAECFTSYIGRLAASHTVSPKNLLLYMWPERDSELRSGERSLAQEEYLRVRWFLQRSHVLNSPSDQARRWTGIVEGFVQRTRLDLLTLLPWASMVSGQKLYRRDRAWCPDCYENWRIQKQPVYDPLLWILQAVSVCPIHHRILATRCTHCHRCQPWLDRFTYPGHCSHCGEWLGTSSRSRSTSEITSPQREKEYAHQLSVTLSLGSLIAAMPRNSSEPMQGDFSMILASCIEVTTGGDTVHFAHLVGFSFRAIYDWKRGTVLPRIGSLLQLCKALEIAPQLVLERDLTALRTALENHQMSAHHLKAEGPRGRLSHESLDRIRKRLESVIAEAASPPPSLACVARELGHGARVIRHHSPMLSEEIAERYRCHIQDTRDQARVILEGALTDDIEPPPSFSSVCRNNGLNRGTVFVWFPELCKAIAKRYTDYMSQQAELRRETVAAAVRTSVFELHEKGQEPSVTAVWRILGKLTSHTHPLDPAFADAFEHAVSELDHDEDHSDEGS